MSVLGATSPSTATPYSTGSTFNFTNTTNAQFGDQLQDLVKDGALTSQQATTAFALGTFRVQINPDGSLTNLSGNLSDTTLNNFITDFQNIDYQMHNTPGSVGGKTIDTILAALQTYQGQAIPGAAPTTSTTA